MESADKYVNLHVGADAYLIRETMNAMEQRLDSHRWFHGEYIVLFKDGTELNLSRTYREKILGLPGNQLLQRRTYS